MEGIFDFLYNIYLKKIFLNKNNNFNTDELMSLLQNQKIIIKNQSNENRFQKYMKLLPIDAKSKPYVNTKLNLYSLNVIKDMTGRVRNRNKIFTSIIVEKRKRIYELKNKINLLSKNIEKILETKYGCNKI